MQHWQVALHDTVTALILAIIIIVVAVPEGLPMMIAIVLALNMQKLLDQNVQLLFFATYVFRCSYAVFSVLRLLAVLTFCLRIRRVLSLEAILRLTSSFLPKANPTTRLRRYQST